jgi:hypothetical protein
MAQTRLQYIPNLLNNLNSPVPGAFQEPITGLMIPGSGLVVGDTMSITYFEAAQLAAQPGTPSPFPLYEGDYQFVHLHQLANALAAQRGYIAFFRALAPPMQLGQFGTNPIAGNWEVTDAGNALSVNLVSGVFINAITPGNFGFIQTAGRASVVMNGAVAIGAEVYVAPSGQGSPTAGAVFVLLGYALTAATAAGQVIQVKLQLISAQQ